jgi:hypothetical protein
MERDRVTRADGRDPAPFPRAQRNGPFAAKVVRAAKLGTDAGQWLSCPRRAPAGYVALCTFT